MSRRSAPGVTALKVGQKVFIAGYEIGNRGGLYAEYAAVPEKAAWPLPDGVGADEATALTNYQLACHPAAPRRARRHARKPSWSMARPAASAPR